MSRQPFDDLTPCENCPAPFVCQEEGRCYDVEGFGEDDDDLDIPEMPE